MKAFPSLQYAIILCLLVSACMHRPKVTIAALDSVKEIVVEHHSYLGEFYDSGKKTISGKTCRNYLDFLKTHHPKRWLLLEDKIDDMHTKIHYCCWLSVWQTIILPIRGGKVYGIYATEDEYHKAVSILSGSDKVERSK